jgi:hypothetical protein
LSWPGARCVLLTLSLVCLTGPAASLVHWLVVPHRTCAEHGELVHGDAPPVDPARAPGEIVELRAAPTSAHDGHDHCSVSLLPRETASPVGPADEIARARPARAATLPADADAAPQPVELVLLAPKNSPPGLS